jgi:hypothetical protein
MAQIQTKFIANNSVSNAKLAQMTTLTIKGNNTGSTANALDLSVSDVKTMLNLTGTNSGDVTLAAVGATPNANGASLSTQVLTLQPFDSTNPGVVTASGGGTSNFLRADGTWAAPVGAGSSDSSTEITNLGLAASVAANDMTIELKDKAGSNPSGGSSVKIGFRNSSATTGTYVQRSVTASLSLVIPSGATLGQTDLDNTDPANSVYIYAIDNAGTVELAVCGTKLVDEGSLISTTAISAAATSSTTVYSTTARTNVAIRLIGRVTSTQTTPGTWATAPSQVSVMPIENAVLRDEVRLDSYNGYGTSYVKAMRFVTSSIIGSAISVVDSATGGTTIYFNKPGIYSVMLIAAGGSTANTYGVVFNTLPGTSVNIYDVIGPQKIIYFTTSGIGYGNNGSFTGYFNAGDYIRPIADGLASYTVVDSNMMSVVKIS